MAKEINVYHLRTVSYEKEIVREHKGKKEIKKIKIGGTPYATVAISINSDGTVNRGVSICSVNDVFEKSIGSAKAIGRMEKAMEAESNVCPINGYKNLENNISKKVGHTVRDNVDFNYLGYFHDVPNELEKKLFRNEIEQKVNLK